MRASILTLVVCLALSQSAWAITILEGGYNVETYATYSGMTSMSYSMVFDDSGNLYLDQPYDSSLWRVTSGGAASEFVAGLNTPSGFDWTGGTTYGSYLYTITYDDLLRIGTDGSSENFAGGFPAGSEVAVDKTGNYDGLLYVTTGGQDHIYSVDIGGSVSMWSDWPGHTDGGGPVGIEFDVLGDYSGQMYVATSFQQSDADVAGLFTLNTSGAATRFSSEIVQGREIGFDVIGLFDYDMYVVGKDAWDDEYSIWRVAPDGSAIEFALTTASTIGSLTFGPDGALYVSEYTDSGGVVTISRVIPEPGTVLLLGLGAVFLRRKR